MTYPLVRDLAAEGFPVRLTCRVLGCSTQAFFTSSKNPVSCRDLENAYAINTLIDAHGDDPAFGYRCLADKLKRAGIEIGERRAWRLCSQQKLRSTTVKKGRIGKQLSPAVNDDLLCRDFAAALPNRKWVTDSTEHPTAEGKVYCCAIKDLFSNRIVGHGVRERMTADLAVTALRTALARREPDGVVIVHADRGSQFRSRSFQAVLKAAGHQGPMSRVVAAGDNAAIEPFWALLQRNVLNTEPWSTRAELDYAITYWIEHTYNRKIRHRRLRRLTPIEFKLAFTSTTTQAAT